MCRHAAVCVGILQYVCPDTGAHACGRVHGYGYGRRRVEAVVWHGLLEDAAEGKASEVPARVYVSTRVYPVLLHALVHASHTPLARLVYVSTRV